MNSPDRSRRIADCYNRVRSALLAQRNAAGHWVGQLSTSALSTATAVTALELISRTRNDARFAGLIQRGLRWLAEHQNSDGGWGDTVKSLSNISTTMLARAAFRVTKADIDFSATVRAAENHIAKLGGKQAVIARYGKDKTFSIPILTHCALAGLVDWSEVQSLPFELACIPAKFYKTVRLPVVSYALPALIAIGQVRYHHLKPRNPFTRMIRKHAIAPSLRVLERIQPKNGGFLEAAPLTSFVTMSLAGMGLADHPVARKGVEFLIDSVREDGSWPIDTNLATWVTTLSVNALRDDVPEEARPAIRKWLLVQQYRTVHPYTNADPGGWAWTDLPGGVPDADDTPGAILALLNLRAESDSSKTPVDEGDALAAAVQWLLDLQNRDGGWPTFCRGWGNLPFDRSSADLTAHAIRALRAWTNSVSDVQANERLKARAKAGIESGFQFLSRVQRADGSWLPLWFGNQHQHDDENPVYGTTHVLAAYRDVRLLHRAEVQRAVQWLSGAQNDDGGWGGAGGHASSVEETALAVEILLSTGPAEPTTIRGVDWLLDRVESGTDAETSPIGFYFAKLWYFEMLYPQVFTAAALKLAHDNLQHRVAGLDAKNLDRSQPAQHV